MASAVTALATAYAERSVEQRRAAIAERASGIVPQGGHSYAHVSEYITVVKIVGELSTYNTPPLRQLLVDLIYHGRIFLVLDMTEVDFSDSTGQGVLVGALKRVRAHDGRLALVVPHDRLAKVFRITGLTKVFPIFDTVDRAVEFLGRELGGHG
ncbi:STAS domain-containing protein [Streptomyces sp. NPDC013953]|uniref:STAS domain-containing protein n=1 Tax=Streptomyces sp. NPDC013953 TaxID=3364868 RepID=UPI0036FAEA1E